MKLKKTLMTLVLGTVFAAGVSAEPVLNRCEPIADVGLFFVDWSGSMFQESAIGEQRTSKMLVVKTLLAQMIANVPQQDTVALGLASYAPHVMLISPKTDTEQFVKDLDTLPLKMEVFGRHTNLGEGLKGLDRRVEQAPAQEDEAKRQLQQLATAKVSLILVGDGGATNMGDSAEQALQAFHQKYPNIRLSMISLAATDEEKAHVQALAQAAGANVYPIDTLMNSQEAQQAFVAAEIYRPCPKIELSLSADTLFAFDSARLKPEGVHELEKVAAFFAEHAQEIAQEDMRFGITAHTDKIGTHEYNKKLSERRLQSVLNKLTELGMNPALFEEKKAFGKTMPVTGDTCKGIRGAKVIDCLQPDRRVEIRQIVR